MQSPSSNALIERLCALAQSGDGSAEEELFSLLTDSFRIFAKHRIRDHASAEDVVQDALAVVAQKYKGISFDSSFAGWAHNVLRNTLLGYVQSKAIRTRLQPEVESAMDFGKNSDPDNEFVRMVLHCLDRVARSNRKFARVLNLRYQGFTSIEMAQKLELKIEYLYVTLARARSMLEACLGLNED